MKHTHKHKDLFALIHSFNRGSRIEVTAHSAKWMSYPKISRISPLKKVDTTEMDDNMQVKPVR